MVELKCEVDSRSFGLEMNVFRNQLDYAVARGINGTAVRVQEDIRKHINDTYTIRRAAFAKNSVKITEFAKKESPSATVAISPPGGASRDVWSKFEAGEEKTSLTGGKIAIPLRAVRPDEKRIVPKAKRPRNLKNAFKGQEHGTEQFLLMRTGRGKNAVVKPAYLLVEKAEIKPSLKFEVTALNTVRRVWQEEFAKAWDVAVATALK